MIEVLNQEDVRLHRGDSHDDLGPVRIDASELDVARYREEHLTITPDRRTRPTKLPDGNAWMT